MFMHSRHRHLCREGSEAIVHGSGGSDFTWAAKALLKGRGMRVVAQGSVDECRGRRSSAQCELIPAASMVHPPARLYLGTFATLQPAKPVGGAVFRYSLRRP